MNFQEQTVILNDVEINFIRKPAKKDTRHLIFVFSGFSGDGKPTYNWNNVLLACPAEIIWIKDSFDGGESYYLCSKGNRNIESAIIKFMELKLKEQNLNKSDCTLMGGSKGGAAALYYTMRYNFTNLVTVVPQFFIGSYVEVDWPYAFNHMMHGVNASEIKQLQLQLDNLIPDAIKASFPEKNIYLITSHADEQFYTEIQPNLHLLEKFDNFNLIFSDSNLVTRHNQVNRHTVSITAGLANLLSMGIPPRFNNQSITYRSNSTDGLDYLKPLYELKKLNIENSRLFIEGFAIIYGIPCPEYTDIAYNLILKNRTDSYSLPLAKGNKNNLNNEIGIKDKTAYYKGWFCTLKYAGISIDDLPVGDWQVFLEINVKGIFKLVPLKSEQQFDSFGTSGNRKLNSYTNENNLCFKVINI